jgi:hypothetical protein
MAVARIVNGIGVPVEFLCQLAEFSVSPVELADRVAIFKRRHLANGTPFAPTRKNPKKECR